MMATLRRYHSFVADSGRWEGFAFRPGDVVITTPPKAGTTWTQMLCALLIFGTADLPAPLSELSPWLDMLTIPLDEVTASLEAQQHRRFIKTHTPLDGLPRRDDVTYVCVGRDPRDVSLSWVNHMANMDMEKFINLRFSAVGMDDLPELGPPPTPPPDDPVERFWAWVDGGVDLEIGGSLANVMRHLQTFWEAKDEANVALFHYGDLAADLTGQMRRLADVLDIEASDEHLADLASAASFDQMKARADDLVPNKSGAFWKSNTDFFHRGGNGQRRDLIDDDGVARYQARMAKLAPPDLVAWSHDGWLGSGLEPPA
jgi:hypothetical protein